MGCIIFVSYLPIVICLITEYQIPDVSDNINVLFYLALTSLTLILLLILLIKDIVNRHSINSILKGYIKEKDYETALRYIQKISLKTRSIGANKILLFNLGYVELLKDNVDDATFYLQEYATKLGSSSSEESYLLAILFLYVIYYNNGDKSSLDKVISSVVHYQVSIGASFRVFNRFLLFRNCNIGQALEYLRMNDIKSFTNLLSGTELMKIPLVSQFVNDKTIELTDNYYIKNE
jgi:pentatricopeptide repeat protein